MAFEIVVVADMEYEMGNETFVIPKRSISQSERTLVSRPAFKEDVTTYSVMFKADTTHGTIEWKLSIPSAPMGLVLNRDLL